MWVTPVLDPPAGSTGSLSTDSLHAYIDAERVAAKGKPLRPSCLGSYRSTSTE
jgi:hypothetical protein